MLKIKITALRPLAVALMAGFLIVACAGVPGTTQPPGTTQQPGPASPGTSPRATVPAATSLPGGGVDVQDPCGLITVEEVSAALGTTVVAGEADVSGSTTYCNYRSADGTSLLATSFSRDPINQAVFNSFAGAEDAVRVPGIAEDAVISGGAMYVRQGDALVGIQPSTQRLGEIDEQQVVALLTALAQAVAGRL